MSSPSAASPIVPVTTTRSPGLAPLRRTIWPGAHPPERRDRNHHRTRRRNRIAAQQRTAELRWRPRPARARTARARHRRRCAAPTSAQSRPVSRPWRRDRKGSPAAPCARRCPADRSSRKCTPSTMASVVTTISSPERLEDRRIVDEIERAGIGRKRLESTARSACPLRMQLHRGQSSQRPARTNSSARNWRPIWSSTAFTMPVSSASTKACATSTYSETTTRPGTSLRCSSS